METIDVLWLGSTVFLSMIGFLRYRARSQPIGSLIVAVAMMLGAMAILTGKETLAECFQIGGIIAAGVLIAAERRWKRERE